MLLSKDEETVRETYLLSHLCHVRVWQISYNYTENLSEGIMKFHVGLPLKILVSKLFRHEETEEPLRQGKMEEPIFQDVDILYNFVFDLGNYLNPTEAARKILEKDFSLAAANYTTGDMEMALHFKPALRLRQQAQQASELSLLLQKKLRKDIIKWLIQHPRWLISTLLFHLKEIDAANLYEKSQKKIEKIDNSLASFQEVAALHRYSEELLFTPFYLREVPFIRVELQPFSATINGKNTDIDVWLLIHRTGVAIITFGIRFSGSLSVDDINKLQAAENILISESKIVKSLFDFQASPHNLRASNLRKKHSNKNAGRVDWYKGKTSQGSSLIDAYNLYQAAIISAITGKKESKKHPLSFWLRSPDWIQYPILFIRQVIPECHEGQIFKERFPQALAGIDLGNEGWREVNPVKYGEKLGRKPV